MNDPSASGDDVHARLRASEDRIRLTEVAGGIATFELDVVERDWEWTPQIASIFGFEHGAPKPTLAELERAIFVDDVPKVRAAIDAAIASGQYYVEFRVRAGQGPMRWIAGKGEAVKDAAGRPRWLRGLYTDITERKALEARLLALNESLEARVAEVREEARILEILNRTGAALAGELSLEKLVQTVTDAAVEATGAKFGAFFYNVLNEQGESYMLYTLSGAPREAFEKFPLPRNTPVFEPTFRGEGTVRSDDILADPRYGQVGPHHGMPPGHLPVRSYLAIPVVSRSGEVIGGLFFGHPDPGVFTEREARIAEGLAGQAAISVDNARLFEASQRELAARRDVETALQRMNETLEQRVADEIRQRQEAEENLRQAQKIEAIGQLTGGIAHDFNNLLTIIFGNLQQLQRRLPDDPQLQRRVVGALQGTERAIQLTQRLLAFSRRQPLAPQVVNLNSVTASMLELLQRTLGEAIAIEAVQAAGLWRTSIDVNQLENALLNLAVNARDAMPAGGKLTIETANCYFDEAYAATNDVQPGQYVGIFVSDVGVGMVPDVIEKAFEPFFTTKQIGQGTGLGLSQVYGFVKQSDGHVKIYSEVGEGTTVKLYFPRHQGDTEEHDGALDVLPPIPADDAEMVLVVEDEPEVRSLTAEMLRDLGYRVVSAEDGASALRLLDATPDALLLFTDVGLPHGMNGRQLADEVVRRRPGIKVLFTTGYARNAIVHQGRLDPGIDVIFKPFSLADLAHKIRMILDR